MLLKTTQGVKQNESGLNKKHEATNVIKINL